jgi:hypothetical protein
MLIKNLFSTNENQISKATEQVDNKTARFFDFEIITNKFTTKNKKRTPKVGIQENH